MAASDDDDIPLLEGRITSPRATDKDCLARLRNISQHDAANANLASPAYHGGPNGVDTLSLSYIHECGYRSFSTDVVDGILPCYSAIQLIHKKVRVRQAWLNPRTLQSGPLVERIIDKSFNVFPKLKQTFCTGHGFLL